MPMMTTEILTRGYELDGTRTIPPAVLIRYMEWGRWEFLNSEQNTFRHAINSLVVAAQSLVVLAPVVERINLEISVWLSRVGNTSLDISQMIVDKESKMAIALGRATLVNVDSRRRPKVVAETVKDFIDTSPANFDGSLFPKIQNSLPIESVKSIERRVMPSEIDLLKHVNHSRYVDYVEDARKLLFPEQAEMRDPIFGLTLEYKTEALNGHLLTIDVSPLKSQAAFQSQIRHGQDIVANAIVQLTQ